MDISHAINSTHVDPTTEPPKKHGMDCNGFPLTIKQIAIHSCSGVTRELLPALLSAIRLVHPKPWNIVLSNGLEHDRDDILYVVICPAGLTLNQTKMPMYYINWQLEYLNGNYDNDVYIERLRGALANWDYSQFNIDICKNRYNIESIYVPPGFNEEVSSPDVLSGKYLYTDQGKDIDVLFLGWCDPFPRRLLIRDNCVRAGLKCWFVCGLDDHQMKQAIRRSKVCINIATTDSFIFHKIRISLLLSNQACVVSESTIDRSSNLIYEENGVCVVPYDSVVETVFELVQNFELRRSMALKSYRWYRNTQRWTDIVDFNKLLPGT